MDRAHPGARLAYVTIPAAMLLVVAGTLLLSRPGAFRTAPNRPPVASVFLRRTSAVRPRAAGPQATRPEASAMASRPPGRAPGPAPDLPALEEVGSASARVYRLRRRRDDAPPSIFVVDERSDF